MIRLTRYEAEQRIAGVSPSLIVDYEHPEEEAERIRHDVRNNTIRLRPAEEDVVLGALTSLAAHVAYQQGAEDCERAVLGLLVTHAHEAKSLCCEDTVANLIDAIRAGLHLGA